MTMPRSLSTLSLLVPLLATGCRSGRFPQYPPEYHEYAYTSDSGSNTVSVLDLVRMRPETVLQVDPHPVALAANPQTNEIYVAGQGASGANGSLTVIDAQTNRIAAKLRLGKQPTAIAVNRSGTRLYITNAGSNSISVVDASTHHTLGAAGAGESPQAVSVTPDETTLVVANGHSGSVILMDLSPAGLPHLRAAFNGCPGAGSIAVLPDSTKTFIACSGGHQVMVLGLRAPSTQSSGGIPDRLLAMLDVGTAPRRLILKPDGGEIFVANEDSNTISEIATNTNEVGGAALIGARPGFGVASADNTLLWVANGGADSIGVYSIDDGKLINTVHVGSGPGPVAFSADGHALLAVDTRSADVAVVRTFSRNFHREAVYGTLFTMLPVGSAPSAIVVKAFKLSH